MLALGYAQPTQITSDTPKDTCAKRYGSERGH
jgi:hypothetical protein